MKDNICLLLDNGKSRDILSLNFAKIAYDYALYARSPYVCLGRATCEHDEQGLEHINHAHKA